MSKGTSYTEVSPSLQLFRRIISQSGGWSQPQFSFYSGGQLLQMSESLPERD